MKRTAIVVVAVVVVAAGALLVASRSTPDGPEVVVGSVEDFPAGSITRLDLDVKLTGYVPRISDSSDSDVVEVPIFLVSDRQEGLLALYVNDPHLGCRVALKSEFPLDAGYDFEPEVVFLNPCHFEMYDRLGRYIAGPAPRGLDRFGVSFDGADVVVDVAAFEYGPDR